MSRRNRLGPPPEEKPPLTERQKTELGVRNGYAVACTIGVALAAFLLRNQEDMTGMKWLAAAVVNMVLGYVFFLVLYRKARFDAWAAMIGSIGVMLLIGGLVVLLYYQVLFQVYPLIPAKEPDLGLLLQRRNGTLWSAVAMVTGVVTFGFGVILSRLERRNS